ncbi:hypothetical protein SAMN05421823_108262 [Catalinimonas alkaloidigena]|uniref:Uncharacterized protein n=1 Tax=Catalinimonas alkaloidigena TaxID=1075417 RepID=A0A1G9NE16_9BACT|nr:hypothetical protein SAMN05421823_108262 [Catalinimonas alkaloidigena]
MTLNNELFDFGFYDENPLITKSLQDAPGCVFKKCCKKYKKSEKKRCRSCPKR